MSIKQYTEKIKGIVNVRVDQVPGERNDFFLVLTIILVAFGSFGLGRLSVPIQKLAPEVVFDFTQTSLANNEATTLESPSKTSPTQKIATTQGSIVASKTGEKYHFPWCSGAQRIKEENKVWFASEAEARTAGYEPASNCKGLK